MNRKTSFCESIPHRSSLAGTYSIACSEKTGVEVSCVGVGGLHIGLPKDESQSIKIIRSAIDAGITFMDQCWDNREGRSEQRMG